MSITILHNPRCSKSRQTLALLQDKGITPKVREYLKDPLSAEELKTLIGQLGISAEMLLRKKEAEFKAAGLDQGEKNESDIIAALVAYPKLMERPIVISDGQARIGRPPEQVLEII